MNLTLEITSALAGFTLVVVCVYFLWIFYEEIQEFKKKPLVLSTVRKQSVPVPGDEESAQNNRASSSSNSTRQSSQLVSPVTVPASSSVNISLSPQTQIEREQQQHRQQGAYNPAFVSSTLELDRSSQ